MEIGSKHSERAFLAKEATENDWQTAIMKGAEIIGKKIFEEKDLIKKEEAESVYFQSLGVVDGEDLMRKVEADPNNNELKAKKELMVQSIYLAMRGNVSLVNILDSGKVDDIEKELPDKMKGFAREIRNCHITNVDICSVLDMMDKEAIDNMWNVAEPGVEEELEMWKGGMKKLRGLGVKISSSSEDRRQLERALLYVKGNIDRLDGQGNKTKENETKENETKENEKKQEKKESGILPELVDLSDLSIKSWAIKCVDIFAELPGFNMRLVEVGVKIEGEFNAIVRIMKENGQQVEENAILEARKFIRSAVSMRSMEKSIFAFDGSLVRFAEDYNSIPTEWKWNKEYKEILKKDIFIGTIRNWIEEDAYEKPEKIAENIRNENNIDLWADRMAKSIESNETTMTEFTNVAGKEASFEDLFLRVKMAIGLFVVEDYPRWCIGLNGKMANGQESHDWLGQCKKSDKNGKEQTIWGNGGLEWNHPMMTILRPVDELRKKGMWNEDVLGVVDNAVFEMAMSKYIVNDSELLSMSDFWSGDVKKWGEVFEKLIGDGNAVDDFKGMTEGLYKLKSIFTKTENYECVIGYYAADIFYAKVLALMSQKKVTFSEQVTKLLSLDKGDVPEEIKDMLIVLKEAGLDTNFGQVKEAEKGLNLNMDTEHLRQAVAMLVTGTSEPDKALENLKRMKLIGYTKLGLGILWDLLKMSK